MNAAEPQSLPTASRQSTGRWKLFAVIAICASPMIASYLSYYVIKPQGRTNYGAFIDPRAYPIPTLSARTLDGRPMELTALDGKWRMVQVGGGECPAACQASLYGMRQLRLAQGKEMTRVERVWLVTDDAPIDTALLRAYDGTHALRVDAAAVRRWLPTEAGTQPADHLYLIDPLGNLMMRFPKDPDLNKVKKDLGRLLKASGIG